MAEYQSLVSFASPISIVNYGNEVKELNKQLIKDIDDDLEEQIRRGSFRGDVAQTFLCLEDRYESFNVLKNILRPAVSKAMIDYGYDELFVEGNTELKSIWGNRCESGGWSLPHWHGNGNTLWSGVYYPVGFDDPEDLDDFTLSDYVFDWEAPDDGRGCLIIEDPALFVKVQVGPYYPKHLSRPSHFTLRKYVKPREGLLVLFPAWQNHSVSPTTRKRYSISFAVDKIRG